MGHHNNCFLSFFDIQGALTILNVSGNNLDSIEDLQCLTGLVEFSATDNQLSSMKELSQVLGQWTKLTKLDLTGNPLCLKYKYRDRTITMGRSIGIKLLYTNIGYNYLYLTFIWQE